MNIDTDVFLFRQKCYTCIYVLQDTLGAEPAAEIKLEDQCDHKYSSF